MRYLISIVLLASQSAAAQAEDHGTANVFATDIRPVLEQFCSACHDQGDESAPEFLKAQKTGDLQHARSLWYSVAVQLRNRTMPPADEAQPAEADRLRIARWIERTLRETACDGERFAGWVPARRLNRFEYENTIRDLFGIELGFSRTLPADSGGGEGFDNNGETLFLPPLLLERYLEAAQQIVDASIIVPPRELYFPPADMLPEIELDEQQFRNVSAGQQLSVVVPAPLTGDYTVTVGAFPDGQPAKVFVLVDGIRAESLMFRPYGGEDRAYHEETRIRLTRGLHSIAVQAPADRSLRVARIKVNPQPDEPTAQQLAIHRRLLGRSSGYVPVEARVEARQLIERFVTQAFRRPATETEVAKFLTLYDRSEARGDSYEERVKLMIKGVLVSPDFLFRLESRPQSNELTLLTGYELATRLSYFLWSTMPDAELQWLAREGTLQDEETILAQVDRMLDAPQAAQFYTPFVGQWLGTRDVGGSVAPTFNAIQNIYTPDIASDMRREAVLLFESIVREDRSLLELVDSDFQFMTGRLARFYGIAGAEQLKHDEFQRVALPDGRRGGVLGLGAVLAATSHVTSRETSPVLRGAWVLDTLLGTPVPAPPPDVPELDRKAAKENDRTMRDVLESHRANRTCAACHDLMDPLGFALENFDFLGRWRQQHQGSPIDASASLPSGEQFAGPAELKQALLGRKRQFLRQISRKMLGYALGRSLVDADQCTIESVVDRLEESGYSARTLIKQIVLSPQFRYKQLTELTDR